MGSVFLRSWRDLRGAILVWGLGLTVFGASMALFFPSVQDFPHLEDLVRTLPRALQAFVGDPAALHTFSGFLKLKLLENLPLLLAIFAITHAADSIAGEDERGTLELLLAHPVDRWRVVLGKFVAVVLAVGVLALLVAVGLVVAVTAMHLEADRGWLLGAVLAAVPVALLFGAVGLFGSCLLRRARGATYVAGAYLGLAYLLHLLAPVAEPVRRWALLSPVHTYLENLPMSGPIDPRGVVVPLLLTGLFVGLSLVAFGRRDIKG